MTIEVNFDCLYNPKNLFFKDRQHMESFINKLSNELTVLVSDDLDSCNLKPSFFIEPLQAISKQHAQKAFLCLDEILYKNDIQEPVSEKNMDLPELQTREDLEIKLQRQLKCIPEEDKTAFKKVFWDIYNYSMENQNFVFTIYYKMKRLIIEFFLNEFQNLSSSYRRLLDNSIYYDVAYWFTESVYEIKSTYLPKSNIINTKKSGKMIIM